MNQGNLEDVDELGAYVQQLVACQTRLRAYINAAVGNSANAADVLQRTNLVLWKKAAMFRRDAEFLPWALGVARNEVLGFIRDNARDRHVFSHEVASMLLDAASEHLSETQDRQELLSRCLERLPERSRNLLRLRYADDLSIEQIASQTDRTQDSVKSVLLRLRKKLEQCVQASLIV